MDHAGPSDVERSHVAYRADRTALGPADVRRLLAIVVAAIAVLVAVTIDWQSPVRVVLTLGFLLFVPGLAITELLAITDVAQRVTLAIGASLALETLVAVSLRYSWLFSAEAAVDILVGVTCVAVLIAVLRRGGTCRA